MKPDLSKLKARLEALRAKTTANGCTEAEALAAAAKAAELLAASGLTDVELDAGLMEELAVDLGSRRTPMSSAWQAVASFADCRGWLTKRGTRWHYVYFGDPGNVLVAEYVHEVIRRAAATAIRDFKRGDEYQRRRTPKTRAHALKAHEEGLASGLHHKIKLGLWRRKGVEDRPAEERQALIAAGLAPVNAELARRGYSFSKARALVPAKGRFRDAARVNGFVAGRAVDVDAPLAGAKGGPALIGGGTS